MKTRSAFLGVFVLGIILGGWMMALLSDASAALTPSVTRAQQSDSATMEERMVRVEAWMTYFGSIH
tara:strand:- start:5394 stop:5591 length:198 start_codon:yes stop_codon:yes gene_type:complete